MVRACALVLAVLIASIPASTQPRAKSGASQQANIDALIAKRGFGPTYDWNDYDRLYRLTDRGTELLASGNFDSVVRTLADEQHFSPDLLRTALRNFLRFVHSDRSRLTRASYDELIQSSQLLGDAELGAQMAAVALYKLKEHECARGDMATILNAFKLSPTQAWTIVDELICTSAIQDFLAHFSEASRAVALRAFGYDGATRSENAALDEWRVQPENLALIRGDDRGELIAEWRRAHIASLLQFGLADEAARFYRSLDPTDRAILYAIKDGLYWADVGGLRERTFRFFRLHEAADAILAFRLAGHGEVANEIAKHGLSVLADRNWECLVKLNRDHCDKNAAHHRTRLLLIRYLTVGEAADPYYLVEAAVSSNSNGRLSEGAAYGIPYAFCARLKDSDYRTICDGAEPPGAWASEAPSPISADGARLNAAMLKRHPDILAAKLKFDEAQRILAKSAKAAPSVRPAWPAVRAEIDERLVEAFRAARPALANINRADFARRLVVNRAGDRAFVAWGDGRSGATYRAVRAPDGSWSVTEISNWIAD